MHTYSHGRHEHGQNFLIDRRQIGAIVDLVGATSGPIIEIGPGGGALTPRLIALQRDLTAVEVDPRLAEQLKQRHGKQVRMTVVNADVLAYRFPSHPHVVVGNLPFHLTTAILRRLLHAPPGWTDAVLLVQWEVARRRAGVGGATMMTAQWEPWFEFSLHGRVPARAFTPMPGVDGGLLAIRRRADPLVPRSDQRRFQALVHRVYTGRGHGLAQVLTRAGLFASAAKARTWLARFGLRPTDLPKSLPIDAWVDLFQASGSSPPRDGQQRSRQPRSRQRRRSR